MAQTKQNSRKSSGGTPSSGRTKSSGGRTKSSSSGARSSGRRPSRAAAATKRTPTATKRSGNGSTPTARRSSASRSGGSRGSSGGGSRGRSSNGPVASARETVKGGAQNVAGSVADGAQSAGRAVGSAASAAKVPAVAGGAALAGLVGGMAIARGGRRRVLGIPVPGTRRPLVKINARGRGRNTKNLVKTAGHTGRQMAELAIEVRQARQQLEGNARKRSPIEVVLDGLTARRPRDLTK